ncbi:carboxypeptidase regulatory-like domain-containing protein [Bacillus sp. ISL-35]|uniref:carboxypeptidase-like regulatory domain-containing protein n=1 Tax=Bacillus sp. ISL-35 TaxID=2819122 RepID=UPI001BE5DC9B|nr:carboxypeptidase-like regulatory domain-containing protein [Bacillus sp. ISL-35]MBT2679908.1 carboxypeptidase regulatory-like domain-containing protein [Bacillus sp. ISL-35]MBT2704943.1 carboxypeptidase regulatory-like domain-containing protein [Chryseobacterium sp. ISL-80]
MAKKVVFLLLSLVFVMSAALGNVSAAPKKEEINSTVKGSIKENGKSLKNSLVILQEKGKSDRMFTATDASGAFKAKLADGTYTVKAIKSKNEWFSTNESFAIKEGKIKGNKDGAIHLSDKQKKKKPSSEASNFSGVLKEGDKGLKADLILARYGEYDEEIYVVSSKNNGSFSAYLPDGIYYLYGVEEASGFYRYTKQYTVVDGVVQLDGEAQSNLEITLPVKAHHGKVGDSAKPLAEASIILEKRVLGEEYDSEFIEFVTANKKGEFSLRKLEDGIYSVGVDHATYSAWNQLTFEVVDGDIYIEGEEVSSFHIVVPDLNVKGTVTDGKKPVANSYVIIEGDEFGFGTPVDSKGNFAYRLADGHYTIFTIDEPYRSTMVNVSFEIKDGKMVQDGQFVSSLNIQLPPVTFSGKLVEDGVSLQGEVAVETLSQDGNYESYYAMTDENGIYSMRLKDGSYRVTYGYLFEEGEGVPFATDFEISNGKLYVNGQQQSFLELEIPPVSLHGLVKDGENPVVYGDLVVASEDYSVHVWKNINSDGTFTMRLPDGNYHIREVYLEGTSAPVNLAFSIQDGKLYVGGELQEVLEVNLPSVTVTGTLSESGTPLMGELYVTQMNEADMPLEAWSMTNEEGVFKFRLPDGEYAVGSVYLFDGTSFSPSSIFTVESGELYINGEKKDQLDILVPPISVTGTLTDQGTPVFGSMTVIELNNEENPLYAWTWIDSGNFQLRMPDGEYRVLDIGLEDGTSFNAGLEFSVVSGKLYINGEPAESLDIAVPAVSLKGTLYNGQNPVTEGIVTISTMDGDWVTDSYVYEGSFNGRLPDGEYKVLQVADYQIGWFNFDQPFTILEDKIYVDGQEVESLSLNLHDGWQEP